MSVVRSNPNSQYDPGLIVKEVHDFNGQFIRTANAKSLVPGYFSHLIVEYNVNNDPTVVNYYRGLTAHLTNVFPLADNALSLQNTYFTIRSNPSGKLYHVWYNVNGLGVDPSPVDSIGIEIPILENDSASIITLATVSVINSLFSSVFLATNNGVWLEIRTIGVGTITASSDFNSGFTLQNILGTQVLVKKIEIGYDLDDNPVYEGQVLKGYSYDIYDAQFKILPENVINLTSAGLATSARQDVIIGQLDDIITSTATLATEVNQVITNDKLDDIISKKLDGYSVPTPDSVNITGSLNGTSTGQKYGIVYTQRQQILDAQDRQADFNYLDFGTKNQRVSSILYTSSAFPGVSLVRTFNYTLLSGRYRRDNEIWSIV